LRFPFSIACSGVAATLFSMNRPSAVLASYSALSGMFRLSRLRSEAETVSDTVLVAVVGRMG